MRSSEQVYPEEAALIPRLLDGVVACVCRGPWLVLAATVVLVGLSLFAAYTRLEYRTSRNDLINPHKDCQRRWQRYLEVFGSDDDIVVVVEGADHARMQHALDAVADAVGRRADLFDRLFWKVDLRPLRNRALLYLPPEEIHAVQVQLSDMGSLLELGPLGWHGLTLANLVQEANRRADRFTPADEPFWRQLQAVSQSAEAMLREPAAFHNPWSSMVPQRSGAPDLLAEPQYFFSADGSLAFLLVRPTLESGSFTAARRNVEALRTVLAQVRADFPELSFGLTGLPVLETDEMTATQEDTNRAGWLALAGVALLYLLVYRGLRYPLFTVVTLLTGTAWALGWLTWTVGHLNILSATFAIMLIGMGDYGVLWVTRYEQERRGGADARTALRATARGVGPGILTAALTTALAFYAAMLADFQAVLELGWIAGSGVLFCALACFTVLPALLMLTDRNRQSSSDYRQIPIWERIWLPSFAAHPRRVLATGLALMALVGCGALFVSYDHNLLHMQAHGLESVQWEMKLIERTAGASWHALSYRASRQEVLELKARFEQLPEVSRVVEVASLVPDEQEKKLDLLRDIQRRLRWLPERTARFHPGPVSPARLRDDLHTLLSKQPVRTNTTALRESLRELAERIATLSAEECAGRLQEFDRRLAGSLCENLHRLRDTSQPVPLHLEDLPAPLRERHVSPDGQWLLRVFARDCLWDFEPLGHFVRQVQSVDPEATGKPFTTYEGLGAMKRGFQWAALYALAAIVLVLLLDFRSLRHTLLALAPLVMGVLVALGVMGLCGVPLNPANMIAFPLILGVGVDNGVHVIHDYLSRQKGKPYSLSRTTGRGILVAALTTVLGFGALMIAQHRGQVGLGFTLSLGVSCCMVAALVILPALLRLASKRQSAIGPSKQPTVVSLRQAA